MSAEIIDLAVRLDPEGHALRLGVKLTETIFASARDWAERAFHSSSLVAGSDPEAGRAIVRWAARRHRAAVRAALDAEPDFVVVRQRIVDEASWAFATLLAAHATAARGEVPS